MRFFLLGFLLIIILLAISCTPTWASRVTDQLARGRTIYEGSCATTACHGINGEGIRNGNGFRAWPLVGEEFQRRNPTAQVIFDVVRSGGEQSLRAMTDQQIFDSIAYELSLNDVQLNEPLNSQNAPELSSGAAAGTSNPGSLFPPSGNARLITTWSTSSLHGVPPHLPISTENKELRIRLTQIALAASIGEKAAPAGGSFVTAVINLEALTDQPLEVGPQHLSLATEDGQILDPLDIGLDYPVARFYQQTIQPEHGTAALAIFALPVSAKIRNLRYSLPDGQLLALDIVQ